ncbi:polysaccharide deacetylase family protein [Candidatus Methylacidiphilum infernorum]|uniref:Polysaccharide deacetylase family protein n=1 Tax=Candidatus Methylacidiphilum infernorum TaxID=511746 RepID=A0ABX7PTD6_9BACT|nr:polysaccharide deacetylase family protein [Candidatus Methylacidiphilum infernorum]QSR86241.1 polysaccharide deacetylase family protein [Candidatus Methylacidiphilum infernorum]
MKRRDFFKKVALAIPGFAMGISLKNVFAQLTQPVKNQAVSPSLKTTKNPLDIEVPFVHNGPGFGRRIAVTFDDGPAPICTEMVLKALESRKIPATFFMLGEHVKTYPSLVREVHAAGHEIGNHTFNHPQLSKLPDAQVEQQIRITQDLIVDAIGNRPLWLRPPYGSFRRSQAHIAYKFKLGIALWNVDTRDWTKPGIQKILEIIEKETRPGSIILMHDIHRETAQNVGRILDFLLEKEYEFSTLTGFIGEPYTHQAVPS